jgi:hypothetical protein
MDWVRGWPDLVSMERISFFWRHEKFTVHRMGSRFGKHQQDVCQRSVGQQTIYISLSFFPLSLCILYFYTSNVSCYRLYSFSFSFSVIKHKSQYVYFLILCTSLVDSFELSLYHSLSYSWWILSSHFMKTPVPPSSLTNEYSRF